MHITKPPLVSAIMATHNNADTIASTIGSILQQSLRDIELIVVDDGSSDNTKEVLYQFSTDSRVRILCSDHQEGSASARNLAARYASSEFLAICDADDLSLPNRFERQFRCLAADSSLTVCGAQLLVFSSGQMTTPSNFPTESAEIRDELEKYRMPIAHCAAMIRRSSFERVGGYDKELLRAQDFDLFLRLRDEKMISLATVELLYRRKRPTPFGYAIRSGRGGALARQKSNSGNHVRMSQVDRLRVDARTTAGWLRQLLLERGAERGLF